MYHQSCRRAVLKQCWPCALTLCAYTGTDVPSELQEGCSGAALAIWTTTPWTMPANAAVAVNEKLQYSLVEVQVGLSDYTLLRHPTLEMCGSKSIMHSSFRQPTMWIIRVDMWQGTSALC